MGKRVIISESAFKKLLAEEIISEGDLTKDDVSKMIRDSIKDDRDLNKQIEKKVKSLVAASVNTLFRTLWQRRNFYEDEIKK